MKISQHIHGGLMILQWNEWILPIGAVTVVAWVSWMQFYFI